MKWLLLGGGVVLAGLTTLYLVNRSEPVAVLPENPDNQFAQQVQEESFLERQRFNEAYWNRWKAKCGITKWKDTNYTKMEKSLVTDGIMQFYLQVFSIYDSEQFDVRPKEPP